MVDRSSTTNALRQREMSRRFRLSSPSCSWTIFVLNVAVALLLSGRIAMADELPLAPTGGAIDFDAVVAPLLGGRCLECHSGSEPEGGLDLRRRQAVFSGGASGPAVVAGDLEASLLWQLVDSDAMPPEDRPRLTAEEKATLRSWITAGASWGEDPIDPFRVTSAARAGRDWWSLRPLGSAAQAVATFLSPALTPSPATRLAEEGSASDSPASRVPTAGTGAPDSPESRSPIDIEVRRSLAHQQLVPSPPADSRTLVRRVYFDLIGLPPTPEEVAEFVADPSDEAYAALVDKLLSSPHYGERWARHWLDIVRFGESDGFERNLARENAWPYRDWVIAALNDDMPYDQFVRWQIAGDILEPDNPQAIAATGFLVAGLHNTVVANNETARAVARHDELEDRAAAIGQAFLGLTVHCARCHDHKFDPITQEEYYRFVSALDGVQHGQRTFLSPEQRQERELALQGLQQRADQLRKEKSQLEEEVRRRFVNERSAESSDPDSNLHSTIPVAPRNRWSFESAVEGTEGLPEGGAHGSHRLHGGAAIEEGRLKLSGVDGFLETEPLSTDLAEKTLEVWATLDNLDQRGGGLMTVETLDGSRFDSIVFGERQAGHWMAGSNNFRRTQDVDGEAERHTPDEPVHLAIVYHPDGRIALYRDGLPYGKSYRPEGADSGLQTYSAGNARVLFGKRHTGAAQGFWAGALLEARLYDRALAAEEIRASFEAGPDVKLITFEDVLGAMSETERARHHALRAEWKEVSKAIENFPEPPQAYAAISRQPPVMQLLERGDVRLQGKEVTPGGIQAVGGSYEFGLPADAGDGARRVRLAQWITSPENPLFARVLVNRLWHHHFGQGLVDTPSDFGFNGSLPSHPELLDYLAAELLRHGYRLKPLHRQIVLSETYRQASTRRVEFVARDADNRWLWRMVPRRLEAEAIRDSMLLLAGELNFEMGGPGYEDVSTVYLAGTTYYEPLENLGFEQQRRTIYRFSPRGERSALLDTFDCPDPSVTTPRRQITTTPLQALALWNDEFVLRLGDALARRVERETADGNKISEHASGPNRAGEGTQDIERRIARMYQVVFQREPSEREALSARTLVEEHGLGSLARALLNSNEFVIVE